MSNLNYFTGCWFADLTILETYLDCLEYKTGTARLDRYKIPRKDGGSVLYGYTYRGYLSKTKDREWCPLFKQYKTVMLSEHPELMFVFRELRDLYFPEFMFNSVQLNYNYKIPKHKDSPNTGDSVLVCCGDYTGGDTIVLDKDKKIRYNARTNPVIFDGSKLFHYVEDFVGDRYSLVFFN